MGIADSHLLPPDAGLPREPERKEEAQAPELRPKIVKLFQAITKLDERIETLETHKKLIKDRINKVKVEAEAKILISIEKDIEEVRKKQEKYLKELSGIIDAEIPSAFAGKVEFSPEEREQVFKAEKFFRNYAPPTQSLKKFYQDRIAPAVKAVKSSPRSRTIKSAAAIGEALTRGRKGLSTIQRGDQVIQPAGSSGQEVYLRRSEGLALKKSSGRAGEEESLFTQASEFFPGAEVMRSARIHKAAPSRLEISSVSQQERLRGYSNRELNSAMKKNLMSRLDVNSRERLSEYEKYREKIVFYPGLSNPKHLKAYEACEAVREWFIEGSDHSKTFKEIQILYLREGDALLPRIRAARLTEEQIHDALSVPWHAFSSDKIEGLQQFSSSQQKLPRGFSKQELHAEAREKIMERMDPKARSKLREHEEQLAKETYRERIFFLPDLSNSRNRAAYEACEAIRWVVEDSQPAKTFKEIQNIYLKEGFAPLRNIRPAGEKACTPEQSANLKRALFSDWIAVLPEVLKEQGGGLEVLESFDVKPFAEEMILVKTLSDKPNVLDGIFRRLTPEAQRTSILTGELQMLDMHSGNLGLEPVPNEEYQQLRTQTFDVSGRRTSFKTLLQSYVGGQIDDNTTIRLEGQPTRIGDIPELHKALNVGWRLVVFDTDLSLSEGNELMWQTSGGSQRHQHLIPLRSVILERAGKDVPLSSECLDLLKQSEATRRGFESWMKRHDAPLWRRLPAEDREALEKELYPLHQLHSIARFRKDNSDITIAGIGQKFTQEISDPVKYTNIWNRLESAAVKDGDTLATFAQRHKIPVQRLRELNPQLGELEEGAVLKDSGLLGSEGVMRGRLKITDLSSSSEEAAEKRSQLAPQLFPRLTLGQQKALLEREEGLTSYLRDYERLKTESQNLSAAPLQEVLKQFVEQHSSIFTTAAKEALIKTIAGAGGRLEELQKIRTDILSRAQPTYFNAMKRMYPLLADAYELIELIDYADDEPPGRKIGLYTDPLEKIIQDGQRKRGATKRAADRLALRLLEVQESAADRGEDLPFFGAWR